ncbi:unnamed protein product, partial [Schistosoma mattheei]
KSSISHEIQTSSLKWNLISPVHVIDAIYQYTEDMHRCKHSEDKNNVDNHNDGGSGGDDDNNKNNKSTKSTETCIQLNHKFKNNLPLITMKNLSSLNNIEINKKSFNFNKINTFNDYRIRNDSNDLIYWNKYKQNIVTEEWEDIWNNLYLALEKYYNVLKHRAKLIHDTDGLRKQNAELRHLLQQYMNSKVRNIC